MKGEPRGASRPHGLCIAITTAALAVGCGDANDADEPRRSAAALEVTASFPLDTPGPTALGTTSFALVPAGGGSLLFYRTIIDLLGEAMVQRLDAAGAPVGEPRGVAATFNLVGPADRQNVWAASYGPGALVVAQDARFRFVAARVDAAGAPLDRAPLVLFTPPAGAYNDLGGVACNASQCLAVYKNGDRVAATRVAVDGRVLDAAPIDLGPAPGVPGAPPAFTRDPVVAFGDGYVVAWSTLLPGSTADVRVARVALDGRVLDPGGRAVTTAGGARGGIGLATDGARVFMAWDATASGPRPDGVYAQLFDRDLNPLAPFGAYPDLRALGTPRRLFWDGSRWVMASNLWVARFASAGEPLDARPRPIDGAGSGQFAGGVPGGFVLVHTTAPSGSIQRYDSTGARVGSPSPVLLRRAEDRDPAVASDGAGFLAGWVRDGAAPRVARVSAAGAVLDRPSAGAPPCCVSTALVDVDGASAQYFGLPSSSSSRLLRIPFALGSGAAGAPEPLDLDGLPLRPVLRSPTQRIVFSASRALRFSPSWSRLDPAPIQLTSVPSAAAAAAFDGTHYLFVLQVIEGPTSRAPYARRLDLAGDFVDPAARDLRSLGAMRSPPWLAFGAGTHLLVWVNDTRQILGARLALDGTPGAPFTIGASGGSLWPTVLGERDLAVTFDGVNFVVVWLNRDDRRLRAVRVSPAGVALDRTPLVLTEGGDTAPANLRFGAASDGRGSTLVAYDAYNLDLWATQVRGVLIREDGVAVPDAGAPDAASDAAPDAATDAGADASADAGADASADAGADVRADAVPDVTVPPDAAPDVVAPPDAAPDVIAPPDIIAPPDAAPDVTVPPDVIAPPDASPDVATPPDATIDVAAPPDVAVDAAPDASADVPIGADAVADAPVDADAASPPDAPPDASSDTSPDAPPDVPADVTADAGERPVVRGSCTANCTVGSRGRDGDGPAPIALTFAAAVLASRRRARRSPRAAT